MRLLATLIFAISVLGSQAAYSADRVALVIGNSNYRNIAALANPKNDATDIAAALRKLGFDVVQGLDALSSASCAAPRSRRFSMLATACRWTA